MSGADWFVIGLIVGVLISSYFFSRRDLRRRGVR